MNDRVDPRTKEGQIDRLRARLAKAEARGADTLALAGIIKGILDLLKDRL